MMTTSLEYFIGRTEKKKSALSPTQRCDEHRAGARSETAIERWHHTRIRGRVADVLTIFTPYSHIHTIFTYSHHIRRRFAARFHVFTHIHTHSYPFTLVNVRKGQLSIVVHMLIISAVGDKAQVNSNALSPNKVKMLAVVLKSIQIWNSATIRMAPQHSLPPLSQTIALRVG